MLYRVAADAVLALHFAFVAFVALGGFLVLRWPWAAWLHLPAAAWGAAVELGGWICPLTPLENALRIAAGEAAYGGDFIARYLLAVLYPEGLTRSAQLAIGLGVIVLNGAIYALLWRRRSGTSRVR